MLRPLWLLPAERACPYPLRCDGLGRDTACIADDAQSLVLLNIMDPSIVLYVLGGLLIAAGLAGIILPALPGVPLIFIGMLVVAWADGFTHIGPGMLMILGLLMVLSVVVDFIANLLGAQRAGASKLALLGAAIGTVAGLFFGIIGIVFGPFIGAVLGELAHSRHGGTAAKVGVGTWVGLLLGTVAKIGIAFVMLGIFVLALLL